MSLSVTVVGSHGRFGQSGGLVTVDGSFGNQFSVIKFLLANNAEAATVTGGPFGFGTDIENGTISGSFSVPGATSIRGALDLSNGDTAKFSESIRGIFDSTASLVVQDGADTVYAATGGAAERGIFDLLAGSLSFINASGGAGSVMGGLGNSSLTGASAVAGSVAGSSALNAFFLAPGGPVPVASASSVAGGGCAGLDSVSAGAAGTSVMLPDSTTVRFLGVSVSVPGGFSI